MGREELREPAVGVQVLVSRKKETLYMEGSTAGAVIPVLGSWQTGGK